ncbi:MAG: hypothetical protein HRU49_03415 [Winogradskyella sp.]|uniref:hypothetical protein n=1 Tax=Winogradskyella sp. TaxID=1883156 RepID=UPI0025FEE59A|nr:hypothetical protein [Winogradskyella sp.]NRB82812.1 hypothetical protein [Winogradskyella sp.]
MCIHIHSREDSKRDKKEKIHNIMMKKGADLIIRTIDNIAKNIVKATIQNKTSTDKIAPKIEKFVFNLPIRPSSFVNQKA